MIADARRGSRAGRSGVDFLCPEPAHLPALLSKAAAEGPRGRARPGRAIIVELPTDPELTLFTEDAEHFYYGAMPIDKREIVAVRVLINGSPIAAFVSPR